ncbi:alpha/beta fold hydrolase [Arsenicicoccus cauae]|nr:alpha/beta hydrolase [Arsenicicoccus cauae]
MTGTPWITTTDASGLAVHAWAGDAPPGSPRLLMLHGLTDSGPSWEDAARRWGSAYVVIAPDALGHGQSRRFTPQELASTDLMESAYDALRALVGRLMDQDATPVLVAGHSMGGGLAAALSARMPDAVRAAVLEDPVWFATPPDPSSRDSRSAARERIAETMRAREDVRALAEEGRRANPTWPERELTPWAQASADCDVELLRTGRAVLDEPWRAIAAELRVPTLVVTGTEGVIIDGTVRAAIEELGNPRIEVAVVDGAEHCVRRTRTEAFHAVVDPWLAAH